MIVKRLAENIRAEVFKTLESMYNHRKEREGLVSCQNSLINSLKQDIDKWYGEQIAFDKRMQETSDQERKG